MSVKTRINVTKLIMQAGYMHNKLDAFIEAAAFIPENAYVREVPVDRGDFKQGIRVKKDKKLEVSVVSTAKSDKGFDYPLALFQGTGSLKGAPDFGYTTGRVRLNDVARGIGGIRPNKAAKRARDKSEKPTLRFIHQHISQEINKT